MGFFNPKSLAVGIGAVVLAVPAGAAVAAPGTDCPPTAGEGGYPGSACTLPVSDTTVVPGEDVTLSGPGYQPGTAYTVTIRSKPRVLATGTTDSSTITVTVEIPTDIRPGHHLLSLTGVDSNGGPRQLDTAIFVAKRAGVGRPATNGPAMGGLGATGSSEELLPLAATGGGLLLLGAGAVAYSRRRRQADSAT